MKHDILQVGECSVTCSCGAVIVGTSLEAARRKHEQHFGLMSARDQLPKEEDDDE